MFKVIFGGGYASMSADFEEDSWDDFDEYDCYRKNKTNLVDTWKNLKSDKGKFVKSLSELDKLDLESTEYVLGELYILFRYQPFYLIKTIGFFNCYTGMLSYK